MVQEKSNFNQITPLTIFVRNTGAIRHAEALSYAVFGQFTYQVSDKLSLTGGVRRTHERKQFSDISLLSLGTVSLRPDRSTIGRLPRLAGNQRYNSWTPMGNLSLQLTDDLLVYGGWSRGFRSGGFNGRPLGGG